MTSRYSHSIVEASLLTLTQIWRGDLSWSSAMLNGALTIHGAQTATRLVSTATTLGVGNPMISLVEDAASAILAALAIAAPILAAVLAVALVFGLWRLRRLFRRRKDAAA